MDKNASFGALYSVDALGRRLPDEKRVGPLRKDRVVGCFYFLTQGSGRRPTATPDNVTRVMKEQPEALQNYDDPVWNRLMYWGEPLFGYYFTDDRWVIRRHAKMLAAAGVDFLIFDTTNRTTFWPQVRTILEEFDEYRKEGWNVPKVAYYTNTKSGETLNEIWNDLYKPGLFKELWFEWDGKPFIIADPAECTPEQQEFFTFRLPQWPTEEQKQNGCPWIDFTRPQRVWVDENGTNDIVPVSVAQHPNLCFGDGAFYNDPVPRGRAFHDHGNDKNDEALLYGYNVAEQWERALAMDPRMVFFTGWNEWTTWRVPGDGDRPVFMCDQADWEYSRDVEPMKGGHFDNYYMQLCDYIRRYKGAPASPKAQKPHIIDINGGFEQWNDVEEYWAMPFGTLPRKAEGHGGVIFEDTTGRNEFEVLKVAHDADNVYFYARTREPIQFNLFTKWMNLYINVAGRTYEPHWHGYHYLVNNVFLDPYRTFVQTCLGGYRWGKNVPAPIVIKDNETMVAIPRKALGLEEDSFELRFQWADHTGSKETIEDFYLHGDTAPYGRFAFVYRAE